MHTRKNQRNQTLLAVSLILLILASAILPVQKTQASAQAPLEAASTGPTGGNQAHENRQPYLTLSYIIALEGVFPSRGGSSAALEPMIGEIRIFAGNFAPRGWAFCEGQLLPISQYTALFSILGTTYGGDGRTTFGLPDLRGRVPIGAGQGPGLPDYQLGQQSGEETHPLTLAELPSHNHALGTTGTGNTGSNTPHNNMQPYLAINYIVALSGVYPSGDYGAFPEEPYLGEIRMFAGNFAPSGYTNANGALLDISSNDALFSLYGTIYGGDGRTTFGLPDLRGRAPVSSGSGPGLTNRVIGQKLGDTTAALTTAQMTSHLHSTFLGDTSATGSSSSHTNLQPTLVLNFKVVTIGLFPSRNSSVTSIDLANSEGVLGEVRLVGFDFPNLVPANGQILAINSNQALFSILGTTYGGDGRTTFALPDLRGRVPIHMGQGPGLGLYPLGSRAGLELVTLSTVQLPAHTHTLNGEMQCGVTAPGTYTFSSQSGVALDISSTGSDLACLYVEEIAGNHPNATPGIQTGKFWLIEGIQSNQSTLATEDFSLSITLPHSVTPDTNAKVCKYTGTGEVWDCARTSSDATTVTRDGISALSEWAAGDNVGPAAVQLTRTMGTSSATVLAVVSAILLLSALAVALRIRKHDQI